jgi:hypothetical protein
MPAQRYQRRLAGQVEQAKVTKACTGQGNGVSEDAMPELCALTSHHSAVQHHKMSHPMIERGMGFCVCFLGVVNLL